MRGDTKALACVAASEEGACVRTRRRGRHALPHVVRGMWRHRGRGGMGSIRPFLRSLFRLRSHRVGTTARPVVPLDSWSCSHPNAIRLTDRPDYLWCPACGAFQPNLEAPVRSDWLDPKRSVCRHDGRCFSFQGQSNDLEVLWCTVCGAAFDPGIGWRFANVTPENTGPESTYESPTAWERLRDL